MKRNPINHLKFKYKAFAYFVIFFAVREINCRPKSPPKLSQKFTNKWVDALVPRLNQVSMLKRYEKERVRVINQLSHKISNFSLVILIDWGFVNVPSENSFLGSPYLKFVNNFTLFFMIIELKKLEQFENMVKCLRFFRKTFSPYHK